MSNLDIMILKDCLDFYLEPSNYLNNDGSVCFNIDEYIEILSNLNSNDLDIIRQKVLSYLKDFKGDNDAN